MTTLSLALTPKSILNPRAWRWSSAWNDDTVGPHTWIAQKRLRSGIVLFEIELGNAALTRGLKAMPQFGCEVQVSAPRGWTMVQDCPRPWPSIWPPMHCAFRRYALYPSNKPGLRVQALAEAGGMPDAKRFDAAAKSYGPVGMPLPRLSTAQQGAGKATVEAQLGRLKTALMYGTTIAVEDSEDGLLTPPWNGWRPWGIPARGAPAGSGIYAFTGWEQSYVSPAYLWLVSACTHERAWHAYDARTGEPVTAEFYGDPGPKYQQCTGDPNNGWLPEFRDVAQHPDPIIPPYDSAHSVRGFRHLVALSEFSDSPMAQRSLRSRAAQMRLQCSEIGPVPSGSYSPPSLRTYLGWAETNPNNGFFGQDTGRQFGWPAYVIAQALKKGALENLNWCKMMVDVATKTAMPSGIFSRCAASNPQDVWYDPIHDTAHAFEVPLFWMGVVGCAKQAGLMPPRASLRAFHSLYEDAPLMPYYNGQGPPNYAYVAARGGKPYGTVDGGKVDKGGDFSHVLAGCALASILGDDPKLWVMNARKIDATKVNGLPSTTDLRDGAGLLAVMQRMP